MADEDDTVSFHPSSDEDDGNEVEQEEKVNNQPIISKVDIAALLKSNPISKLFSETDKFYRQSLKNQKKRQASGDNVEGMIAKPFDEEEAKEAIISWINEYCNKIKCCVEFKHRRSTECTCLLDLDHNQLATFMVKFALLCRKDRQQTYISTMNAANSLKSLRKPGERQQYLKAYRIVVNVEESFPVCVYTFRNLFVIRSDQWATLTEQLDTGSMTAPVHGNKNKRANRGSMKSKATEEVIGYLQWLGEEYGESYATRFTRETTGIAIRESEEKLVELPSFYTKRGLYNDFCKRQGWVVPNVSHKGNYGPIRGYEKRTDSDWDPEVEPRVICDWRAFREIWKENLPFLRIRNKCEDTCSECFIFKQRMKYKEFRTGDSQQSKRFTIDEEDRSVSSVSTMEDEGDVDFANRTYRFEREEIEIQKVYEHVEAAQAMRETINNRIIESQETRHKPHTERKYCFVMDYAQNLELPHLGEEQPGDIYYYSPKNVYVFGISDVSVIPNSMQAYAYVEEDGKKVVTM